MIGLVIVAHAGLGEALAGAAEFIVGHRVKGVKSVGVIQGQDPEDLQAAIKAAVEELDSGEGVIVLADMLGGSPSDMSMSFLKPGRVEVLTGVNLPMLVHLVLGRVREVNLTALAEEAETKAQDSIVLAGRILAPPDQK